MDIRVPSKLKAVEAEAILAKVAAERFAGDNDVPCCRDFADCRDDAEREAAVRALLAERGASAFAVATAIAALKAERFAIRAANRWTGGTPAPFEEERDAWIAWEAACAAFVAYS